MQRTCSYSAVSAVTTLHTEMSHFLHTGELWEGNCVTRTAELAFSQD